MKRAVANTKKSGKVLLVGAGPGDPALLTLRGRDALAGCDAVLYDEIVHPDILRWVPARAERFYVGKKAGAHSVPQDEINRRLAALAASGRTVVRLKGGDPYLFGRGAEEARFLNARKIRFEVIPGVTSPLGAGAYAGIPLTERTASSRVAFVTAHHAQSAEKPMPWKALREAAETLVIFMGVKRLDAVCSELIAAGFKPSTPAAVVSRGTWPTQVTATGTLLTVAAAALQRGAGAPALVIVGDVVGLQKELNWYERQPLFGKRIVITRARSQASSFREKLTALGAEVIELPTIEIRPPRSFKELDAAIAHIHEFDWVVFTSVNGVDIFFDRLRSGHGRDSRLLASNKIAAVGESTREHLERQGLRPDLMPRTYTSEALAQALIRHNVKGRKLLLIRPRVAPEAFAGKLRRAGAVVTQATGYETVRPTKDIRRVHREVVARGKGVDAIVFTSSSTASHLAEALGRPEFRNFVKKTKIFSIGPQTSRTLKALGANVHRMSPVATIAGLIETLEKHS